ncbi:MAG TPA: circularly permuted type 2 ATP-grasp protein [Limnobacter sp.]|uniref:circularly permuted type 2 ATP-grasp protein n=1 Tax=Limnobacter sp. TaxID=2003368 RepID=UPI002ED7FAA9
MSANPNLPNIADADIPWQQAILDGTSAYYSELAGEGRLRPVWSTFLSHLPQQHVTEHLNAKQQALARQIRDNGITYNVYADEHQGAARPWSLDLLPFILGGDDWAVLEQAIVQRARLLNALMVDAYGPQEFLRRGLMPADLVYGHAGYLPQMQGVKPASDVWLHLVAFDLGRGPDGQWWIINHRMMAPSGLGYALENRLSISRSFSRPFRDMQVQHLAGFYRDTIDAIRKLSPKGEQARIALMTPGPYNETYFEHTYLARYLGITLVEGSDLVVRGNTVYLKTVHGLEQIDGLMRRTDDQWLDPLELREDSQLGVPGLLQAARTGGVVLANMPGAGWLESPAMHGFMPGLAEHILKEELVLPSVPSWWCGESPAWAQASERLDNLVIKSTGPNRKGRVMESVMGSSLDDIAKRNWLSRISQHPSEYTLQELIPLSRVPIWNAQGHVEERAMMLRLFAVTDGQGGYKVMPGGLTRIAGDQHGIVSMQKGGSSLDTWVCTGQAVDRSSNLKERLQAKDLKELRRPVSSRAAEHLFWLGRYTERASFSLRLLMHAQTLLEEEEVLDTTTLGFLHELCGKQGLSSEFDAAAPVNQDDFEDDVLNRIWYKTGVGGQPAMGLAAQLNGLAMVAGQLRDRLSSHHWRLLNDCSKVLHEPTGAQALRTIPTPALERIQLYLMAMHGEQSDHMTRDYGWRFLQLGRQLERLCSACDCLLSMTSMPGRAGEHGLALAVAMADSTITYRSRYQHRFEWLPALDLLLFDKDSPYAVQRILYKLNIVLNQLPGDVQPLRTLFEGVYRNNRLPEGLSLESLQPPFPAETGRKLRAWLADLLDTAYKLSDLVGAQYFRLADQPDQVIQGR